MIELIVVVGIIGILMAVLVGTFGGSSESARSAKCLSNMRNLAMAVQSVGMGTGYYPYAGSFDQYHYDDKGKRETIQTCGWISWSTKDPGGKYISPYDTDLTAREFSLTNGTIWASMKGDRDCYVCPGHMRQTKAENVTPLWSYAMNAYFGWASKSMPRSASLHGRGYRSFRRSDRHLLFAELPYAEVSDAVVKQDGGKLSGKAGDPVLQYSDCEGGGNESIGFNHKDGKYRIAHVCFADGHVEKLRAPKSGDIKELTKWLCRPVDDDGNDFDISFDGKQYKKNDTKAE